MTMEMPTLDSVVCANAREYLQSLDANSIDLTVTSPPYDNLRQYHGYTFDFEAIARQLYRVTKPGGVVVWVVGDSSVNGSETCSSFKQALFFREQCGFNLHDTMIWKKDGAPFPESNRYLQTFEYMFVLSKGSPSTCNQLKVQTKYGGSRTSSGRSSDGRTEKFKYALAKPTRTLDNVWDVQCGYMKTTKDTLAYSHPAMFPEELARRHILTWSNSGDIVLDPFIGSGTVAKIARSLNRHFLGCDISQEYVDLALTRLRNTDPMQSSVVAPGVVQLSLFEKTDVSE